ncbi:MAG: NAD(P)-binding domain-containing protein [Rhodobacter sp.]|nr:NAD(P)-binding domain-containing protein [Rhodobacter sp.]
MRIGVLGTGMVGRALATRLVGLGHDVKMGSRSAASEPAQDWLRAQTGTASAGTFAEAAAHGEAVFLAVRGDIALDVLDLAGAAPLADKILVDVSNPLDFSRGMPPVLIEGLSNTTSLGEEVQSKLPDTRVVKTLNTMNADVMVHPDRVPGRSDVFICGEDAAAKAAVVQLLNEFGWTGPIDLGGISAARGTEAMLPVWLRLWQALGTADFNFRIVR